MRSTRFAAAAIVGLLSVSAACSSSGTSTTSTSSGSSASTAATLPAGTAASGAPVKIGFVNLEGGAAISLPEAREGAEAAVKYANAHLGGIGGRPIELDKCNTDGTEASSTACANQMISDNVAAVLLGQDASAGAVVKPLVAAGIPYITGSGNSTEELTTPGAFSLTGGVPAALAAMAAYAGERGYKSFDLLVIDTPAATGAASKLGGGFFKKVGATLQVTPVAAGTADLTPQLSAVSADAVGVLGDANICTAFFKAAGQLSVTTPKFVYGACVAKDIIAAVPANGIADTYVPQSFDLSGTGADAATYNAVLAQYGPADASSSLTAQGYITVVSFVSAMKGLSGDVSPASILAAMNEAKSVPLPMGGGGTFSCDGSAIPIFKQVCSANELMFKLDAKGAATLQKKLDLSSMFAA